MSAPPHRPRRRRHDETALSRRERQIMDAVYAHGEATAKQIADTLPDPPSRTAVRTLLRILEEKGHLRHRVEDRQHIYAPTRSRDAAGRSALDRVLHTFFGGSLESAVAAHLADPQAQPTSDELVRLEQLIREARERGN